ncbi:H-NS family nucleoid-associated regulatory protein [Maritimibacter sp. DP1N21-5]|uniref:H-NS histone family protein n=1 Tax=Maritimibacter sp. DP1N21-5 TaxID=2836867 RepID=UPI001C488711|nr:H-NS histone family protein [Maritimibacter sp. DP1N21-5]MBV7408011.1 H-NS histone family protein [Maritimibacter sp. DP1N21-5]
MKINLKGMSRKELEKLRADVDKALEKVGDEEKRAALEAAQKAAKAFGYSLADLADVKAPRKPASKKADGRSKVAPKFRHPENGDVTWTGRGRQPKWVVEYLANGGSLDDITI